MDFTGPCRQIINSTGQRDHEAGDVKISAFFSEQLTVAECQALNSLLHMQ